MRFFYHYNKPASQARGIPIISLHYRNTCHLVEELVVKVRTWSVTKSESPKFVMKGDCSYGGVRYENNGRRAIIE